MNYLRKTISLFLALSLALSLGSVRASAAEESEDPKNAQSKSMGFRTSGYAEKTRKVPLYSQTDYASTEYGTGSVATSGCTMTAVAMVASYLRGEEISPADLARRFNKSDGSNLQRMEAASTVLDLSYTKTTSWSDVDAALDEGKVVIVLMGKASPFTETQHTIVLTGKTVDGKILVNDPNPANYQKPELKAGLASGFKPEFFTKGFGGAWIYDDALLAPAEESRYPEIRLTIEEENMIASIIWLEARGESFEGQQAIAEIIFNRLFSGNFSESISGIILGEGQFRTTKFLDDAEPGELQYKAIKKALSGPNVLPENVYFFARTPPNQNVWGRIGGHVFCYGY